jgi:ornithine cyclodeaminase
MLFNKQDLQQCVQLDTTTVDCIEQCFLALATRPVVMPPIMRLDIKENNGEVDVKTAYLPGVDSFAIKISPGFFDNPKLGLPSVSGMMVLFSAKTGLLESVLLDKGYLTDIRTAAAGAVAVKWLSRKDSTKAAIIGAGAQAGLQLRALTLVRNIERCRVWARDEAKAGEFAERYGKELGIEVRVASTVSQACNQADIIVTTTPSTKPLVMMKDLQRGQHITAMGSDAEHKNELAPEIIVGASRYLCDRLSQVRVLGEMHHAIVEGLVADSQGFDELGQVVAGQVSARRNDDDITVCDLTGTGAQDTAIATLARQSALAAGLGTTME